MRQLPHQPSHGPPPHGLGKHQPCDSRRTATQGGGGPTEMGRRSRSPSRWVRRARRGRATAWRWNWRGAGERVCRWTAGHLPSFGRGRGGEGGGMGAVGGVSAITVDFPACCGGGRAEGPSKTGPPGVGVLATDTATLTGPTGKVGRSANPAAANQHRQIAQLVPIQQPAARRVSQFCWFGGRRDAALGRETCRCARLILPAGLHRPWQPRLGHTRALRRGPRGRPEDGGG